MNKTDVKVLTVGSINMDFVLRTPYVPRPGESLLGHGLSWLPGGKGANQAVGAAHAGALVTFAGKIGKDPQGADLRRALIRNNIIVEYLGVDESEPTGIAVIMVEDSGENRIIVFPGANLSLTRNDIDRAFDASYYDGVLLSFEIPVEIIEHTISRAAESHLPIYVDAGPARPVKSEALKGVTVLSPNETELEALSGMPCNDVGRIRRAAQKLYRDLAPEYIVVKMGEKGAYIFSERGELHVPAFQVTAVDSTAAGDAFTSGMSIEHIRSGSIEKAVQYGNAAGALAATKLGAQPSLPLHEEILLLLRMQQNPGG